MKAIYRFFLWWWTSSAGDLWKCRC